MYWYWSITFGTNIRKFTHIMTIPLSFATPFNVTRIIGHTWFIQNISSLSMYHPKSYKCNCINMTNQEIVNSISLFINLYGLNLYLYWITIATRLDKNKNQYTTLYCILLKFFSMYHRVPEEYQGTFQATRPFNDKRASWRPMRRASDVIQVNFDAFDTVTNSIWIQLLNFNWYIANLIKWLPIYCTVYKYEYYLHCLLFVELFLTI